MTVKFRPPHKDTGAILKDAARRLDVPTRRAFLRNAIGLGSLTLLSGCDVVDGVSAERMLQNMSDFNDRVQALLFDPNKLALEYKESAITRPFPFNAFYSEDKAPAIDPEDFHLDITGLAETQKPWTLE
jgi:DMSO/TMAO reductase YedYZ molybdopterin-dependent catalytic subunit